MGGQIHIHIGGFYASREPAIINTVLGSCVAVCLFDPVKRIGGMNHIFLPGKADMAHFDDAARYGVNAMEVLINSMMKLSADKSRLVAKAFGGGHVLPAIDRDNAIGQQNIAFTLDFLEREEIRIISQNLGGNDGRKIYFHTDTGEVLLKRVHPVNFKWIAKEEKKQLDRARKAARKSGGVDLF
jgi:chemotaxis protein CheD